ncbi:hypothetical protein MJI20_32260, partial [Salmonella enterica subsp. enterica serovar Anatum]|nr:hypothetical protein [Salmonella enterica subsp. enterica serovar Anatum]
AQRVLLDALQLANRTGFISHFVIEGEAMAQQLRQLIQLNTLPATAYMAPFPPSAVSRWSNSFPVISSVRISLLCAYFPPCCR